MTEKSERSDEEWRRRLSAEQYHVTRQGGTEPPFTGIYWNTKVPGTYLCVCCNAPLFESTTKFESNSGWPSFWQPVSADAVVTKEDFSHGMHRIEANCARCDAHLGHVFPDGPAPTGNRYCMNSASLLLKPDK